VKQVTDVVVTATVSDGEAMAYPSWAEIPTTIAKICTSLSIAFDDNEEWNICPPGNHASRMAKTGRAEESDARCCFGRVY
jgi:hypothetical protein